MDEEIKEKEKKTDSVERQKFPYLHEAVNDIELEFGDDKKPVVISEVSILQIMSLEQIHVDLQDPLDNEHLN